ncbi:unnamed protein product [Blepharisma stoltei]|uniref:Uncharacterized protein n=1 Tax=Blepharisma stoltei TaxID=1481888 RepID=A0AAU9JX72_9CILI|nr:unnamed protein product [Blepharisma stoltei]
MSISDDNSLSAQISDHNYPSNSVLLYDIYLYLFFPYVVAGGLIAGLLILISYLRSSRIELKMIKHTDYHIRIISAFQIANMFIIFAWADALYIYAKMMGEFVAALIGFFVREHQAFRWGSLISQTVMLVMQVIFTVWLSEDIYCQENDLCDTGVSTSILYLMYAQYTIAFIFETAGIILVSNLMMSLGWFYTKRFPPQLNLKQYGIERPKNKTTIYDLFPHPVVYQL